MPGTSSFSSCLLLLVLFFLFFSTPLNAQPRFRYHVCKNDNGNYTADDAYSANLHNLLSSIVTADYVYSGFFNFSLGGNPDAAYAIGLCRGDIDSAACRSCLNNSRILLPRLCPNQKEAIGWYNECMLKYSNRSISGLMETDPNLIIWTTANVSDWDQYYKDLRTLLEDLKGKAAAGSSLLKYAAGSVSTSNFRTLYALLQCTPDLSEDRCENCLTTSISRIPSCCSGSVIVLSPSCYLRYEEYRFYQPSLPQSPPPPLLSPPPPPPARKGEEGEQSNRARTIIIIAVTSVVGLILIVAISILLICRKRKHADTTEREESLPLRERDEEGIFTGETLQFDFDVIKAATDDFSVANKLGEGGFGPVYKGKLSNGETIAVKRLSRNSGQGDLEFKNEVLLVGRLQHRNFVRLLGFSLERNERILVYEFVPNASLDQFIFDQQRRTSLDWDKRFKIIGGIARGLLYLHKDSQLRIIHRDLKVSNIMLDVEMNAKIANFGMAKLFDPNTIMVVNTYGYMAPEYVLLKSDVYSLGVIILEIISGRKNNCFRNGERVEDLLSFVWKRWRKGRASNVIDPTLTSGSKNEMIRCIHIALLCVQEHPAKRPTMAAVVLMLNSFSVTLDVPSAPSFYMSSAVVGAEKTESTASKSNSLVHSNEASVTDSDLYSDRKSNLGFQSPQFVDFLYPKSWSQILSKPELNQNDSILGEER